MRNPLAPLLLRADRFARTHPWEARLTPLLLWVGFLPLARASVAPEAAWAPWLALAGSTLQIALVPALLWRWRSLFPELADKTWGARSLLWTILGCSLSIPVFCLWLALGWWSRGTLPAWLDFLRHGGEPPPTPAPSILWNEGHPLLSPVLLGLRLVGMTLVVPVIEELFFRSAVPRALPTWAAARDNLARLPVLDGWFRTTDSAAPADPGLGAWHWTGVLASALLFTANHRPVDFAAAFLTGLAWSALTCACNRSRPLGLGPAIWSHAMVNAALWIWCVTRQDWAFL